MESDGKSEGTAPAYVPLDIIQPGNTIAKYEIIRHYADGAFKKGYLVKPKREFLIGGDPLIDPDKEYVLKVFKPKADVVSPSSSQNMYFIDGEIYTQFLWEVQQLRKAGKHDNIATIVDAGTYQLGNPATAQDGLFYFVEEYVEGKTLRTVLDALQHTKGDDRKELLENKLVDDAGFLKISFVVNLMCGLVRGVKHLHTNASIAHSDLKPANVLISKGYDKAVITDFGSAAVLGNTRYFQLGSVLYRAPETFRAMLKKEAGSLPRPETKRPADKWALGVIFYECLTNKYPFETKTTDWSALSSAELESAQEELMQNICNRRFHHLVAPSEINRSVPKSLDNIVMNCLQTDSSKRIRLEKALGTLIKLRASLSKVD